MAPYANTQYSAWGDYVSSSTTFTKIYQYSTPSAGFVDAIIIPVWAAVQPTGSKIATSADGANYNSLAAANEAGDGAVGCSISSWYAGGAGRTLYFFLKTAQNTSQGYATICIRFTPILLP